ncbi:MAG: divalent-cation tolerance protein CutA [Candidatus Pacearchaeota archaeon]
MELKLIEIICSDLDEARKICKHLLQKKLISCGNYFYVKTMSNWEKDVGEEDEVILLVKTREENWEAVREEVKKIHSYDVPCIIKLDGVANESYFSWLKDETVSGVSQSR